MTPPVPNLDARWIAGICSGVLTGNPDAVIKSGKADSRLCRPGDLFVALPGEKADGNRFVESAWNNGAEIALVNIEAEVPEPPVGKALIRVSNVLEALQAVAGEWRSLHPGLRVVGITGSNGKTTTKDILASIVRQNWGGRALITRGNYNSDVGLPLMLLELNSEHEVAILEMGMNRQGELAELAAVARPDISLITNVGTAHIGILGSRQNIAAEKRQIFNHADTESVAIVGSEEPMAEFLLDAYPGQVRSFGTGAGNGWDSVAGRGLKGFELRRNGRSISLALPGQHNLMNALAAVEAALALGIPEDAIARGLENVKAPAGRSEVRHGVVTVIRDGYNANPESLGAAFKMFEDAAVDGRRVLVLGEMLELGDETESALIAAGGVAADLRPDGIFLFGASMTVFEKASIEAGYTGLIQVFTEMDRLKEALKAYLEPGDLILLKGSRGSALERLDEILEGVGVG